MKKLILDLENTSEDSMGTTIALTGTILLVWFLYKSYKFSKKEVADARTTEPSKPIAKSGTRLVSEVDSIVRGIK